MANYKNAYITKQASPVDPSEWIDRQEDFNLHHQELQRAKEQQELDRKNKKFEGDFDGEYDMSSSGNGSIDGMLTQIGLQSLSELKDAKEEGEKAINMYGPNSKEYIQAKQRYDNIMKRPSLLKLATNDINTSLNERQKMLGTGNFLQDPTDLKKLDSFSNSPIKWKYNKDGTVLINSGETTSSLKDFSSSLKLGNLIPKIDENSTVQATTKAFKDKVIENREGYVTKKITNPWENYKDSDGNNVMGIKTMLTRQYESIVDDEYAKSVLASRGQFGYDDMSNETKEELKANIINDMVEKSRPYVKEMIEEDFNNSKYSTDSRAATAKSKSKTNTSNGISFVESRNNEDVYAIDAKNTNTNKSARPESYKEVVYDRANNTLKIKRERFVGDKNVGAFKDYEQAIEDQNNAYDLWIDNKDESKSNQLYADYESKVQNAKVKKEALSKNTSDWEEDYITDKTQITNVLSKELGLKNYADILGYFKGDEEEKTNDSTTSELPDINELPDLP